MDKTSHYERYMAAFHRLYAAERNRKGSDLTVSECFLLIGDAFTEAYREAAMNG